MAAAKVEPMASRGNVGPEDLHEGVLMVPDAGGDALLHGTRELLDRVPQGGHGSG